VIPNKQVSHKEEEEEEEKKKKKTTVMGSMKSVKACRSGQYIIQKAHHIITVSKVTLLIH